MIISSIKEGKKIAYKYVLNNSFLEGAETQIDKEIKYFNDFYDGLTSKMLVAGKRVAYDVRDKKEVGVTV